MSAFTDFLQMRETTSLGNLFQPLFLRQNGLAMMAILIYGYIWDSLVKKMTISPKILANWLTTQRFFHRNLATLCRQTWRKLF